jgi:hypothetical protein
MLRIRYATMQKRSMGWSKPYTAVTDGFRKSEVMAAFSLSLKSLDAFT